MKIKNQKINSLIKKSFSFLIVFSLIALPFTHTMAATATLTAGCGHVGQAQCTFSDFMILINNAIKFLLFTIATPIVVLALIYAGFKLIMSAGNPEALSSAKKIMTNVIVGYIVALVAWLVVTQILKIFGFTDSSLIKY